MHSTYDPQSFVFQEDAKDLDSNQIRSVLWQTCQLGCAQSNQELRAFYDSHFPDRSIPESIEYKREREQFVDEYKVGLTAVIAEKKGDSYSFHSFSNSASKARYITDTSDDTSPARGTNFCCIVHPSGKLEAVLLDRDKLSSKEVRVPKGAKAFLLQTVEAFSQEEISNQIKQDFRCKLFSELALESEHPHSASFDAKSSISRTEVNTSDIKASDRKSSEVKKEVKTSAITSAEVKHVNEVTSEVKVLPTAAKGKLETKLEQQLIKIQIKVSEQQERMKPLDHLNFSKEKKFKHAEENKSVKQEIDTLNSEAMKIFHQLETLNAIKSKLRSSENKPLTLLQEIFSSNTTVTPVKDKTLIGTTHSPTKEFTESANGVRKKCKENLISSIDLVAKTKHDLARERELRKEKNIGFILKVMNFLSPVMTLPLIFFTFLQKKTNPSTRAEVIKNPQSQTVFPRSASINREHPSFVTHSRSSVDYDVDTPTAESDQERSSGTLRKGPSMR